MKIKVKYFGRFAVYLGIYSEHIDVPDNTTIAEVLEIIRRMHPELENEILEISQNGQYAKPDDAIDSGELAIFPPISGG